MTGPRNSEDFESPDRIGTERDEIDDLLDRAAADIRAQVPAPAETAAAAARVAVRLAAERASVIADCAGIQDLIPAALAGSLPADRALLIREHVNGCIACRRVWQTARTGAGPVPRDVLAASRPPRRWTAYAAAAAVFAACTVAGTVWVLRDHPFGYADQGARVQTAYGQILSVSGSATERLDAGAPVPFGQPVRTAKESGAFLQLGDGSRIEMRERSELTLTKRWSDTDIRLARGSVIVHAVTQGSGHLYVTTSDCRVAVVGTLFSVDSGTKGSRVAVLKGEVRVARGHDETVLRPGDQYSSSPSIAAATLADEIAWSREADEHMALVRDIAALKQDLDRIAAPGPRTSTRLLDLAPENTVVYVGLPNVAEMADQAHRVFIDRVQNEGALRDWWLRNAGPEREAQLDKVLAQLREIGGALGDEVAISMQLGARGDMSAVTLLASVRQPDQLRQMLRQHADNGAQGHGPRLQIVADPAALAVPAVAAGSEPSPKELFVWIDGDLAAASSDAGVLRALGAAVHGGGNGFAATPFHARLASAYAEGAVWLAGADLERIIAAAPTHEGGEAARERLVRSGVGDARYLVVEAKGPDQQPRTRVSLQFKGPRHGIASWLAAPAPMGALGFISPDASVVVATVMKNPAEMFDDIASLAGKSAADLAPGLDQVRAELGLDVRTDLLAPVGGEFAFALDGPVLPSPSWKAVLEVYDPERLQHAIETLVAKANAEIARRPDAAPRGPVELVLSTAGGRTFYSVRSGGATTFEYAYVDGYLLMGTSRALLEDALKNRAAGVVLATSPQFTALLPRDGHANFSAIAFRNAGSTLGTLGTLLPRPPHGAPGRPTAGQHVPESFSALADAMGPSLDAVYADEDRITLASSSDTLALLRTALLLGVDRPRPAPPAVGAEPPAVSPPGSAKP